MALKPQENACFFDPKLQVCDKGCEISTPVFFGSLAELHIRPEGVPVICENHD